METLVILVCVIAWYFLPTIIGVHRGKRNTSSIFVVNLFFGWTLIGWVVALAWALAYEATTAER